MVISFAKYSKLDLYFRLFVHCKVPLSLNLHQFNVHLKIVPCRYDLKI